MGDAHRQPAVDAAPEGRDACMEFFRAGNHRQDYADVLHRRHGLPRTSGKGLGGGFGGGYKQSPCRGIGRQGAWIRDYSLDLLITKQVQSG